MSSSRRLRELEDILDNMDPSDPRYEALDAEANEIAEGISRVEEAYQARIKQQEDERNGKIERIRMLDSQGKTDQLIEEYGHEFVDDYVVDMDTITSNVSEEQWTNVDVDAKLRQLLYYRIYDTYIRVRH